MRPKDNQRTPAFYFDYHTYQVAQKRQKVATFGKSGNLRATVEATVRSVKQPFRQGKVLIRALFACLPGQNLFRPLKARFARRNER